jgi:hypothetical protein
VCRCCCLNRSGLDRNCVGAGVSVLGEGGKERGRHTCLRASSQAFLSSTTFALFTFTTSLSPPPAPPAPSAVISILSGGGVCGLEGDGDWDWEGAFLFARDLEGGVGVEEPLAALRLFVRAIVGGSKWISVLALSPLLFGEGLGESTRDERATWRMAQIAAVGIIYMAMASMV